MTTVQSVNVELAGENHEAGNVGGLDAVREMAPVARRISDIGSFINMKTVASSENDGSDVTVTIKDDGAVTNGYYEVTYNPEELTFVSAEANDKLEYSSVNADEENGVVRFTFAGLNEVSANTVLATLKFMPGCEDSTVTVNTLERNDDVDLSEKTFAQVSGSGHEWGEPTWKWNDDYSAAEAEFVCKKDSSHRKTVEASISEEIIKEPTGSSDGEKLVTATVTGPDGKIYTTEVRLTIPANPDVPDTGDHSRLGLYIAMTVVSGIGLAILMFKRKRELN